MKSYQIRLIICAACHFFGQTMLFFENPIVFQLFLFFVTPVLEKLFGFICLKHRQLFRSLEF